MSSFIWFLRFSAKYKNLLNLLNIRSDLEDIRIENLCTLGQWQ